MVSTINAQKSVVKKANEDFDAYNYIDAREIYLNIVEDGYESPQVLKNWETPIILTVNMPRP